MRKRNIKTVAHWVIMSILLLFPILMVGVSSFANNEQTVTVTETYEYETNEVNDYSDIVIGNIYKFNGISDSQYIAGLSFYSHLIKGEISVDGDVDDRDIDDTHLYSQNLFYISNALVGGSCGWVYCNYSNVTAVISYNAYIVFTSFDSYPQTFTNFVSESDYLGEVTTTVDIQNSNYKQEVNNWCNGFKNLPVNQWYGQLLNVIGVGQTTNSVMNVIYVYPLYVLWVYLIDLIVDCLLVIIHFGHNALSRLGGDND